MTTKAPKVYHSLEDVENNLTEEDAELPSSPLAISRISKVSGSSPTTASPTTSATTSSPSSSSSSNKATTNTTTISTANNKQPTSSKTKKKKWKMDATTNSIIDFNLMDARGDIIARLKDVDLYTLEECKVILRQVAKIVTADAERDFNNLLFLSELRNKMLFPKVSEKLPLFIFYIHHLTSSFFFFNSQSMNANPR